MGNSALGRAKSNQAHPEKTAQLVEILDPRRLQIFPRPFMKSPISRMWLNDHPPQMRPVTWSVQLIWSTPPFPPQSVPTGLQ